ncbi:MAG: phage portal protein [Candidatus Amulumruptor caecigallinarius]|nr:phage portal protein [Candidatus Amulumruptor caecigallinarius]MCM1397455.1 phage portal protein [Candidatus Amulumruptor caecigallinarius]MCM1454338.1 phage portal protein [bacterium]
MSSILGIFKRKSRTLDKISADAPINNIERGTSLSDLIRNINLFSLTGGHTFKGVDGMEMFTNYAEVLFPIHFIASRIAGAHFEIKRTSNDAIVWCTTRSAAASTIAKILTQPNELQTWPQFVYSHFTSRLATGNAFVFAGMSDFVSDTAPKFKWLEQLWSVPGTMVKIDTLTSYKVRLFGIYKLEEIIKGYTIKGTDYRCVRPSRVWHDRDLVSNFGQFSQTDYLMSPSRLDSVRHNLSILGDVYGARKTIYGNCGAVGMITNKSKDDTGTVALTDDEKKEIHDQYNRSYGLGSGKSPIMISSLDLDYKQIGLSIAHLQPFEETLADAVTIAGAYEIPSVLIPRKDQSTFDNQANAEKAVYSNVIMRLGKQFCQELTAFLGLEEAGYYIDINFDDVACLQIGRKESEEVLSLVNTTCRQMFIDGMISYNDWRGRIHESALEGDMFDKSRLEMDDSEIEFFNTRLNNIFGITTNPQQENGQDDEEPDGSDESE